MEDKEAMEKAFELSRKRGKVGVFNTIRKKSYPIRFEEIEEKVSKLYEDGSYFIFDLHDLREEGLVKRIPNPFPGGGSPFYTLTSDGCDVGWAYHVLEGLVEPMVEKRIKALESGENIAELFSDESIYKEFEEILDYESQ